MFASACTLAPDPVQRSIPGASSLELQTALEVPADDARVFIQFGEQVGRSEVSRFYPSCSIGLRRQEGDDVIVRSIEPTRFDTGSSRSWHRLGQLRNHDGEPTLLASSDPQLAMGMLERERFQRIWHYTEFRLHDPDQPQVHSMRCSIEDDMHSRPLSVEQIRDALGDVAMLRLAGE